MLLATSTSAMGFVVNNNTNLTIGPVVAKAATAVEANVRAELLSPKFLEEFKLKDNFAATLQANKDYARLLSQFFGVVEQNHYAHLRLDKAPHAQKAFDIFVESLDPSKVVLTEQDVKLLKDTFAKGDNSPFVTDVSTPMKIYYYYAQKYMELLKAQAKYAQSLSANVDLNTNEKFLKARYSTYRAQSVSLDKVAERLVKQRLISYKIDKPTFTFEQNQERILKALRFQQKTTNNIVAADVFDRYMNALTHAADTHSDYYTPENIRQYEELVSSSFVGIGVNISQSDDGVISLPSVLEGGPAWKQGGIKSKDEVLAVSQDGKDWTSVDGLPINRVVNMIKGERDTPVYLRLLETDGDIKEVRIVRGTVEKTDIKPKIETFQKDGKRYGLLQFKSFYVGLGTDVSKLLSQYTDLAGIIVDIRFNGGGSVSDLLNLSNLFFETSSFIFQTTDSDTAKSGSPRIARPIPGYESVKYTGPVIVLINGASASASEIFSGAIQDFKRGVIVGSTSFGKGTVQTTFSSGFPGVQAQTKLTIQNFFRISGNTTQFNGVVPDIKLAETFLSDARESTSVNPLPSRTIKSLAYTTYPKYVTPEILRALEQEKDRYIAAHSEVAKYESILNNNYKQVLDQYSYINLDRSKALATTYSDFMLNLYNTQAKEKGEPTFATYDDLMDANKTLPDPHLDLAKDLIAKYAEVYNKRK